MNHSGLPVLLTEEVLERFIADEPSLFFEVLGDRPEWLKLNKLTVSQARPTRTGELVLRLGKKRPKDYWFPVDPYAHQKFVDLARSKSRGAGLRYLQQYIRQRKGYRGNWPDSQYYRAYHMDTSDDEGRGLKPKTVTGPSALQWPVNQRSVGKYVQNLKDLHQKQRQQRMPASMRPSSPSTKAGVQAPPTRLPVPAKGPEKPTPGKPQATGTMRPLSSIGRRGFSRPAKKESSMAESDMVQPALLGHLISLVGISVEQAYEATGMFMGGASPESVASKLGILPSQAEQLQMYLYSHGNSIPFKEQLSKGVQEVLAGKDPNVVARALSEMEDDDDGEGPLPCSHCGGPLNYLGNLGGREHFRCRNCGADHSRDGSGPEGEDDEGETSTRDDDTEDAIQKYQQGEMSKEANTMRGVGPEKRESTDQTQVLMSLKSGDTVKFRVPGEMKPGGREWHEAIGEVVIAPTSSVPHAVVSSRGTGEHWAPRLVTVENLIGPVSAKAVQKVVALPSRGGKKA